MYATLRPVRFLSFTRVAVRLIEMFDTDQWSLGTAVGPRVSRWMQGRYYYWGLFFNLLEQIEQELLPHTCLYAAQADRLVRMTRGSKLDHPTTNHVRVRSPWTGVSIRSTICWWESPLYYLESVPRWAWSMDDDHDFDKSVDGDRSFGPQKPLK